MCDQRQSQQTDQLATGPRIWLRANYEFPSTFSYRMTDVSSQFAVGSPIPSPAAVKLALVDIAIRLSGDVNAGGKIFELVKTARVCVIPAPRVVRFRAFITRLKPTRFFVCPNHPEHRVSSKIGRNSRPKCPQCNAIPTEELLTAERSTGVRDYFLFDGPLSVFIEVPRDYADEIESLLRCIRRFGTSDSICWPSRVDRLDNIEVSDQNLFPRVISHSIAEHGQGPVEIPIGFPCRLHDLVSSSTFEDFSMLREGRAAKAKICNEVHILPLTTWRLGETWAIMLRNDLVGSSGNSS